MIKRKTNRNKSDRPIYTESFYKVRFADERTRYLDHLLARGWATNTVLGIAVKLAALASRIDITRDGGVTVAQIEAAADDWMKTAPHKFRRKIGPHKARTKFVTNATDWLRFLGRFQEPENPEGPHSILLTDFETYLDQERGLSQATITKRSWDVRQLLTWLEQQQRTVEKITVTDIERFLGLPRKRIWSRVTISGFVSSLRLFFRYAAIRQQCPPNISEAIDAPPIYAQETLPRGPSWSQVRELIAGIGRKTQKDIRDRAMIILLAVYGFRAGEVCRLRLENLDWERELIRVWRTKNSCEDLYPLVREAGQAILLYLKKARPQATRREVFLRVLPPFEPLTGPGLGTMVHFRIKALGIELPHYGPHMLRHSCASHLLSEGLSLKEIGDHLGHADPRSTRVYAKVDLKALREVARFDLGDLI